MVEEVDMDVDECDDWKKSGHPFCGVWIRKQFDGYDEPSRGQVQSWAPSGIDSFKEPALFKVPWLSWLSWLLWLLWLLGILAS